MTGAVVAGLHLMQHVATYAGVEFGGTKCVCSLATNNGQVIDQSIVPTTRPEETIGRVASHLMRWRDARDLQGFGIASFGPLDLDRSSATYGFITTTSKVGWQGTDVAGPLGEAVGLPPVFDTDVNGAAMAEILWGAGRGLEDFAYVTVGTGVGVGLIVNGAPTRGFGHCELGHIRVPRLARHDWPGACPFHQDCVEGLASGSALNQRLSGRPLLEVPPDDPFWDEVSWTLAQLCHVVVCAAAPQLIVMGGGVIEGQPHLLQRIETMLRESIAGYMSIPEGKPYVRPPTLGARAGQLGPIALALRAAHLGHTQRRPRAATEAGTEAEGKTVAPEEAAHRFP